MKLKQLDKTIILGLLVLFVLYQYYQRQQSEHFTNDNNNTTDTNNKSDDYVIPEFKPPKCLDAKFTTRGDPHDLEYCGDIYGIGKGCQKFEKSSGRDPKLSAFSIFGSYVDGLEPENLDECMGNQGETLSNWGLCEKKFLDKINSFGFDENKPRIQAIEKACKAYKNNFKN